MVLTFGVLNIDWGSNSIEITTLGAPKPWLQSGVEVANSTGARVEV